MRAAAAPTLGRLFARPIAHRGLHDPARGIIENSLAAVEAAAQAGYGIEVDIQITADGRAVVFHDEALERLTPATGPVAARPAAELQRMPLKGSAAGDRILGLDELLAAVDGRVPLVVELKTLWNGDPRLAEVAAAAAARYDGPIALKSFDPVLVRTVRRAAPAVARGIIGEAFRDPYWRRHLGFAERFTLRHLLHWPATQPDFVSWSLADLGLPAVRLARRLGVPVMSWTVRSRADAAAAYRRADQIVFQDFRP
jgi:glycerophosphoryl diester phosphodiesterase